MYGKICSTPVFSIFFILKLNDFLFFCPELIEELAGATDLKFGMHVEHVVPRNKTKDPSDISTNF